MVRASGVLGPEPRWRPTRSSSRRTSTIWATALTWRSNTNRRPPTSRTHSSRPPIRAELRYAIRARRDAAELARAGNARRHRSAPGSSPETRPPRSSRIRSSPRLGCRVYEVRVVSDTDCNVAVDEKIVAVEKVKTFPASFRHAGESTSCGIQLDWTTAEPLNVQHRRSAGGTQTLELSRRRGPRPPLRLRRLRRRQPQRLSWSLRSRRSRGPSLRSHAQSKPSVPPSSWLEPRSPGDWRRRDDLVGY